MTTAVAFRAPFAIVDRCDRCGARAYLRVEFASGGELLFCAQHALEHAAALMHAEALVQAAVAFRNLAVAVHPETETQ